MKFTRTIKENSFITFMMIIILLLTVI